MYKARGSEIGGMIVNWVDNDSWLLLWDAFFCPNVSFFVCTWKLSVKTSKESFPDIFYAILHIDF